MRLVRLVNELGKVNAGLYLVDRLFNTLFCSKIRLFKYYVFAQPVPEKKILPARRGKDIVIKQVYYDSNNMSDFPRPSAVIFRRFEQRGLCFAAYINDDFAGYLWLNLNGYDEDVVRCRYLPQPIEHIAWDYDVYVVPRYRASFVFAKLWDETSAFLRQKRVWYSMSRIDAFNSSSLASHSRLGAQRFGQLIFLQLGNWQIMLSSFSPKLHVSFNKKAIPTVRLEYNNPSVEKSSVSG